MRNLFYTLTAILAFATPMIHAQQFPWNAYFGGEGADFVTDIKQTTDNGFIIAGYGGENNSTKYAVLRIDQFGDLMWQQLINKDNYAEKAFNILITAENEFIVVGSATSGNRPWLVKLNQDGELIWTTTWTDQAPFNSALLSRGTLLPDGRIVVIGAEGQYGLQPNMFLVAADGQLIEQRSLVPVVPPGWLAGTFVNHIESTADGGFILTGSAGSGTASRAFLWKFDASADSTWVQHYTNSEAWMRSAEHVTQLADGGYLLTGIDAPNGNNSCVIRTDSQGNFMWYKSYPDTVYSQATAGIENQQGQFWITEKRYDGVGTPFFQSAMLTTDASGNLISRTAIMASDSSTAITNLVKTSDGGFVAAGEINEYLAVNEQDLFVLKSDALGNIAGVVLDYVWPGDVNYDGNVDMDDLMILGLTAGASGPPRWNASIDWTPQYVTDWADTVVTGVNFKHADTDGNGLVTIDDTLAISVNYGQTHLNLKASDQAKISGNDLFLDASQATLTDDQTVQIPVILGRADAPVSNLYGLRFSLSADSNFVLPTSFHIDFTGNWIGELSVNTWAIQQRVNNQWNDFGITRTDQVMNAGFGYLGLLTFKLREPLLPGQMLNLQLLISNLKAHQLNLETIPLLAGNNDITLTNSLTAINAPRQQKISLSPNPSSGNFNICHLSAGDEVRIYTASSQLAGTWLANDSCLTVSLEKTGIYLIEIRNHQKVEILKVVISR